MIKRWNAYQYGKHWDSWGVRESPGGGRTDYFPSILTWLSQPQAEAIAAALNELAGYDWYERHPEFKTSETKE